MTSSNLLSALPYDIDSFIQRTKQLITLDYNEEYTYDQSLKQRLTIKQLELLGVLLSNLEVNDISTGLYGRQLITLTNRKGLNKRLKAHTIRIRDVVQIRDKQHIFTSSSINGGNSNNVKDPHCLAQGTIYRMKEDSITIAVDHRITRGRDDDTHNSDNTIDSLEQQLGAGGGGNIVLIQVPNEITYKRYMDVLNQLQHVSNSLLDHTHHATRILNILYNHQIPHTIDDSAIQQYEWIPINPSLNEIQKQAVTRCLLSNDIHLIWGPPGTGKTSAVTELIHQCVMKQQRVLVCAPSNLAVDNIVERLSQHKQTSERVVRVGHPARLLPDVLLHSLDSVVNRSDIGQSCLSIRKDMNKQLQLMRKAKTRDDRYDARNELRLLQKELHVREKNAVNEAMKSCRVVLCTLTGAASDTVVRQAPYDLVIIDEVAQSTEVACLIPILLGKKLVLAGDHHQLGPTIKSDEAARNGLNITLFDRLMHVYSNNSNHDISTLLTIQYRMHSNICKWSSDELYHSKLVPDQSVGTHLLRDLPNVKATPLTTSSFVLIDTTGCNMYEDDKSDDSSDVKSLISDSKSNKQEALLVAKHIQHLIDAGVSPSDIAIISPYNAQVNILRELLSDKYSSLEIGTVDGIQGREKEAVIISMVRSNDVQEIGFLSEHRRTNVAITRARRHVCVIVDSQTVACDAFLTRLVEYVEQNGAVYTATEYMNDDVGMEVTVNNAVDDNEETTASTQHAASTSAIDDILSKKTSNSRQNKGRRNDKRRSVKQQQKQGNSTGNKKPPSSTSTTSATSISDSVSNADTSNTAAQPPGGALITTSPSLSVSEIQSMCCGLLLKHQNGDITAVFEFPSTLSSSDRQRVHTVAEEIGGLTHNSVGSGNTRRIILASPLAPSMQDEGKPKDDVVEESKVTQHPSTHSNDTNTKLKPKQQDDENLKARQAAIDKLAQRAGAKETTQRWMSQLIEHQDGYNQPVFDALHEDVDVDDDNEMNADGVSGGHIADRVDKEHDHVNIQGSNPTAMKTKQESKQERKKNTASNEGNHDDVDIDAIMDELRVNKCKTAGCNEKVGFMGFTCKFCKEIYCTKHMSPILHGCHQQYKADAKQRSLDAFKRSQASTSYAQRGTVTSSERSTMQQKLEKAKENVARKAAAPKSKNNKK